MRLNQFLARSGFGSRRACEELILTGQVTVNGKRISQLATRVEEHDSVSVNGKKVAQAASFTAILHKPKGYTCSTAVRPGERTIFDLLPKNWPRLFYVGRLDRDSEGLLLVTNDGDLSQRLTHPSYKLPKTYIVSLNRDFDFEDAAKLKRGVQLEMGRGRFDQVYRLKARTIKVVLTQGMKRQIREMLARFDYEVIRLVRIQIGELKLGDMPVGATKVLKAKEISLYLKSEKPFHGAKVREEKSS